jgi:hypothetical protein
MAAFANFTGNCGNNSSATCSVGLQSNQVATLNGNADMSSCMTANDGGCVYGFSLTGSPGIYDYVVNVDAQGPSGVFSGAMYLAFTDQSGDTYKLMIYSSHRSVHTVRYNSHQPAIMKVQWSNTAI